MSNQDDPRAWAHTLSTQPAGAPITPPTNNQTLGGFLVVVLNISMEDGPLVYAQCTGVVEQCMDIERAEWKAQEGHDTAAVFQGTASVRLSEASAALYGSDATKTRVRSISYRAKGPQQSVQFPGHKPG